MFLCTDIMKLNKNYFQREDVVFLAKDLLGKLLITQIDGVLTGGIITETEAYCESEKGCHAYQKRRTERTKIMFEEGGVSYVYFCYGMHHLFNVVTGKNEIAQAVLIRAIHPTIGIDTILRRRGKLHLDKKIAVGPGNVCQALGITKIHYGVLLTGTTIWIEKSSLLIKEEDIEVTTRIGIDYAEEDKFLPWRFILKI